MKINSGDLAPAFAGTTYLGEAIDLEALRGKKVWLGFYRWASCPLCNLRIKEVIDRHAEFEAAGITHVAVFQSPPDAIAANVATQAPPFPIIADPDMRLYDTYGVKTSLAGLFYPRVFLRAVQAILSGFFSIHINGPVARVPADFLVDPEGLVWKAYYGQAVSDHIPFTDIDAFGRDLCLDMPEPAPA